MDESCARLLRHIHATLALRTAATGMRRVHLDASSLEACGHMLTAYAGTLLAPLVADTQFVVTPLPHTRKNLPTRSPAASTDTTDRLPAAADPPRRHRKRKREVPVVADDDS